MKILAAFDKFKDSMTAANACEAAARGVQDALGAQASVCLAPLTDGGEGFCGILTQAANGYIETHTVCGPLGADLSAPLGWCDAARLPQAVQHTLQRQQGKIAIIEMAAAAGLEQVPAERRHPAHCTTYGIGELIRIAVAENADAILLGIGGSATSDLGLGALVLLSHLALSLLSMDTEALDLPALRRIVAWVGGEMWAVSALVVPFCVGFQLAGFGRPRGAVEKLKYE